LVGLIPPIKQYVGLTDVQTRRAFVGRSGQHVDTGMAQFIACQCLAELCTPREHGRALQLDFSTIRNPSGTPAARKIRIEVGRG